MPAVPQTRFEATAADSGPWDLFCRVVDNHGDLGVCWRLAADLAARGQPVRLWVDDARAMSWMAPCGAPGVTLLPWRAPLADEMPGPVVIEAFGCDAPEAFIERMARQSPPPVWINLEYLSAQTYVERSHRLPSPQWSGPARGLTRWFFYPGFTQRTGGLLREPGLLARRDAVQSGAEPVPDALSVSLFCYANTALPSLLEALSRWPADPANPTRPHRTRLKVTPGWATRGVADWLGSNEPTPGSCIARGTLDIEFLPYLSQREFDHLLWTCDLNLVRGEDSLVRGLWAARPLLWQLYPQDDDAHRAKLEAFLDGYFDGPSGPCDDAIRTLWRAWNDATSKPPGIAQWHAALTSLRDHWRARSMHVARRWAEHTDLACALLEFVTERQADQQVRPAG